MSVLGVVLAGTENPLGWGREESGRSVEEGEGGVGYAYRYTVPTRTIFAN